MNQEFYKTLLNQTEKFLQNFDENSDWTERDEKEFLSIPISTLLEDDYFLGLKHDLYPVHKKEIIDLWRERKKRPIHLVIDIEAIGSGKTTKFGVIMWLLIYEVICRVDPQLSFGLKKNSGIGFICMNRNRDLARLVTFKEILPFFDCPFFREHFPPQVDFDQIVESKKLPSRLEFPKRIAIFPGTGSELSALGYNLFGGGIDEANFLEVTESSRKIRGSKVYDAGEEMFKAIRNRMTSRFMVGGRIPGLLMLFSNPRYENDFLERMVKKYKDKRFVYVMTRKALWEAKPWNWKDKAIFSGKTFDFDTEKLMILEENEKN